MYIAVIIYLYLYDIEHIRIYVDMLEYMYITYTHSRVVYICKPPWRSHITM